MNKFAITYDYINSNTKMSRPERLFQDEGYLLVVEKLPENVHVESMMYEWVTFNLPGGRYTPDFLMRCSDRSEIYIEVKQENISKRGRAYRGQSYRDSRSKLRAAASLNPWHTFYMAIYSRGGWKIEYIEPDPFIYPTSIKVNGNGTIE